MNDTAFTIAGAAAELHARDAIAGAAELHAREDSRRESSWENTGARAHIVTRGRSVTRGNFR